MFLGNVPGLSDSGVLDLGDGKAFGEDGDDQTSYGEMVKGTKDDELDCFKALEANNDAMRNKESSVSNTSKAKKKKFGKLKTGDGPAGRRRA